MTSKLDEIVIDPYLSIKTKIANFASRSEKTSWQRKQTNMVKFIENHINPIEQQIIELQAKKQPLFDQLNIMREEMIETCIHPAEDLTVNVEGIAVCNICMKRLNIHTVLSNE